MYMLSNSLVYNDDDDITYSSLTMRALQWSVDSLQNGLKSIALPSYLFCFPKYLIGSIALQNYPSYSSKQLLRIVPQNGTFNHR